VSRETRETATGTVALPKILIMPIVAIGLSHRTAPVTVRERFAFPEAVIPQTLQQLRDSGVASEAVILSTCNRVELYAFTELEPSNAFPALRKFILTSRGYGDPITDELYTLGEPSSVEHLFRVACGLDSMVLGETEILGQLKKAYDLALQHKHSGGRLNKAFQKAFNVAKQIRTDTNIQRGSISVGSVAVELAEKIFSTLKDRNVLVIGAGDTSEKTARSLQSRGASGIVVTNRSQERAEELAAQLSARTVPFDNWAAEFAGIDIIISSTSAPHYVLDRAKLAPLLKLRKNRPLLLIDIAVPRDIDPEINFMENVYLYNIDDLRSIAADYLEQRKKEVEHCEAILCEKARALLNTVRPPGQPAVAKTIAGT
jgi:glutamyl-tRNA reductase